MKKPNEKLYGTTTLLPPHPARQRKWIALIVLNIAAGCLGWPPPATAAPGSWTQKKDMPAPRSGQASCVVDGILYVIGGHYPYQTAVRTVWAYDPQTDSWTQKADMPTARRLLAAAAVDGIIYVIGGGGSGAFPGVALKTVEAYDPKTDTWVAKAEMPTPRQLLVAAAVDGIIYVIGGGSDFGNPYSTVEAFDPKTNQWSRKRNLPKPLLWSTASVVNGRIYVFVATGTMTEHPSDTFAYDPTTDLWTTKAQFSLWSVGLMSSEVDGIIYLFGGATPTLLAHDFVLAYDPSLDRFTPRRKMPRTRMHSACGAIAGKIYLTCGLSKDPVFYSDAVYYKTLDVFDPQGGVTPQILNLACESTNHVRLAWQGEAGLRYGVQSRPNVVNGSWTRVMFSSGSNSVMASSALVEVTCLVPTAATNTFFRVLEL
jgi:hypothetical protein